MNCFRRDEDYVLEEKHLNLSNTLFCGQAFRWRKRDDGSFHCVVKGRAVTLFEEENRVIFKNTDEKSFNEIWAPYFDLSRDYEKTLEILREDGYLKKAQEEYPGIRILHQDPWEALCSFIISQNNNIPRISGIIERLCEGFGEDLGEGDFTFPSFDSLAKLSPEELSPIRAGFRNKYIVDAAKKCASGEVDLSKIEKLSLDEGRDELLKIKGVGPKVADCTLLYGFGKVDAFPKDVWVKRITAELYPEGLPECFKNNEGIAQQYLFHWRRNLKEGEL